MEDQVTLRDCWASIYGMRCRIALEEKGIQYRYIEESLRNKSVPVLIHNGKSICESLNTVQYIDETWKDKAQLMPADPYSRSQARFWPYFIDYNISNFGKNICTTKGVEQEAAKKGFVECLKVLERELGSKSFFSGEAFGFLDLAIIAYYSWFHAFEKCGNFSIESECPKLIAWAKRCLERESVSKSLPDCAEVYKFVLKIRRKNGLQ